MSGRGAFALQLVYAKRALCVDIIISPVPPPSFPSTTGRKGRRKRAPPQSELKNLHFPLLRYLLLSPFFLLLLPVKHSQRLADSEFSEPAFDFGNFPLPLPYFLRPSDPENGELLRRKKIQKVCEARRNTFASSPVFRGNTLF